MRTPLRTVITITALTLAAATATMAAAGTFTDPSTDAQSPGTSGQAISATPGMPHIDWAAGAPTDPATRAAFTALMHPDGEYAALAQYSAILDKYPGVQPYARIRDAEQRHVDALTRQLTRRGVTVPANPWLGRVTAPDNLAAAAQAWADGEVSNVALYDELLTQTDGDTQLTRVLNNLRRASLESHLPAFRAAAAAGGTLPA